MTSSGGAAPAEPDVDRLDLDEDLADGGRLSPKGRRAAIAAALPLLATYFADAPTWTLETQTQLHDVATSGEQDAARQQVDDLAAALRLRAGLAAAQHLLGILRRITARPTFRYTQTAAESVGAIRGRLDLARYSRSRGRLDVPRRYPVRQVIREEATPENILAAYAAQWIDRDLGATPSRLLPPGAPERRELDTTRLALRNAISRPGFAGPAEQARRVWRRRGLAALLDRVRSRLASGQVSPQQPYQDLTNWIADTLDRRPLADPGEIEWAFYDGRFDTKLFEIWCLQRLALEITALLGPANSDPPALSQRGTHPLFTWRTGAGSLNLHFQPSLIGLASGKAVWRFQPGDQPLAGYPDLAVTATRVDSSTALALIDPKLRQRSSAPTEEIYKLLGYFAQLDLGPHALGAIVYYSPGLARRYQLRSSAGGVVEAVAVDPADEAVSQPAVTHLADLAIRTSGLDPVVCRSRAESRGLSRVGDEQEEIAATRQALAVEAMAIAAAALPGGSLNPTRKSVAASLHDVWPLLSEETQIMLVTAEYFGNQAPDDADHSGPLLGLAAAVERVLHEGLLGPAASSNPGQIDAHQTLGSALRLLDAALSGRKVDGSAALANYLAKQPAIDRRALGALVRPAKRMNVSYRIPAAHRDVVDAATWVAGRAAILDRPEGLLHRLARALLSPATS